MSQVKTRRSKGTIAATGGIAAMLVILAGSFALFFRAGDNQNSALGTGAETQLATMMVISVGVLLTLLIVAAFVFQQLGLADPAQPLGLPEGSVRALIALFLIMIFVLFSIYLFRRVDAIAWDYFPMLTEEQVSVFNPSDLFKKKENPNAPGTYNVWIRIKEVDSATQQFATAIFTATLTLMTAVSSFYFASRDLSRPASMSESTKKEAGISLTNISPSNAEASKGEVFISNLAGSGFSEGVQVKLRRQDQQDIDATDVEVLTSSRVLCKFNLAGKEPGKWDVVINDVEGNLAGLKDAFEIR